MKLPRGHTPRVTADGRVEVHRHDEAALARGGFGERMLRSLGWRDGDGLGVGRQGRAEAVRVTQKLDNKGVGANKASAPATDWGDAWWERAFDQGAKKHRASAGGSASSSDDSSDRSSDSSDDTSDASTSSSSSSSSDSSGSNDSGDSEKKRRRKKKPKPVTRRNRHRDGTLTSATAAEMEIARELALDPWGRFGGREGKMSRIARMEAEAAAKASAVLNETLGEKQEKRKHKEKEVKRKKEAEVEVEKNKESSSKKEKKKSEAPIIILPFSATTTTPEAPATPLYTPPAGWWGNSFFVHAGRLEGLLSDDERAKKKKGGEGDAERGFTDVDQEALAERATALKAAGKRGLGATSSKKEKVVGHDWKGSKIVFGDDGGGGNAADENAADENAGGKREKKKQKKEENKTKEAPLDVSSLKWKRAIEAALLPREDGGGAEASSEKEGKKGKKEGKKGKKGKKKEKGLSVSKLAPRVAAALVAAANGRRTSAPSPSTTEEELEAALGKSLRSLCESSSRFEVDKKGRVKLAAKK